MKGETTRRQSLRHHQVTIERCLADVKAGKNIGHLSELDVAQMITDLEKRLTTLTNKLATSDN